MLALLNFGSNPFILYREFEIRRLNQPIPHSHLLSAHHASPDI